MEWCADMRVYIYIHIIMDGVYVQAKRPREYIRTQVHTNSMWARGLSLTDAVSD